MSQSHRLQIQYRVLKRRRKQIKQLQEESNNMKLKIQSLEKVFKVEKNKNVEASSFNEKLQKDLDVEKKKTNEMVSIIQLKTLEINTEKYRNKYLKRKNRELKLALEKSKKINSQLIKQEDGTEKELPNTRNRKVENDEEIMKKIILEWKLDGNNEIFNDCLSDELARRESNNTE